MHGDWVGTGITVQKVREMGRDGEKVVKMERGRGGTCGDGDRSCGVGIVMGMNDVQPRAGL